MHVLIWASLVLLGACLALLAPRSRRLLSHSFGAARRTVEARTLQTKRGVAAAVAPGARTVPRGGSNGSGSTKVAGKYGKLAAEGIDAGPPLEADDGARDVDADDGARDVRPEVPSVMVPAPSAMLD